MRFESALLQHCAHMPEGLDPHFFYCGHRTRAQRLGETYVPGEEAAAANAWATLPENFGESIGGGIICPPATDPNLGDCIGGGDKPSRPGDPENFGDWSGGAITSVVGSEGASTRGGEN
jgi:hypothetical protein